MSFHDPDFPEFEAIIPLIQRAMHSPSPYFMAQCHDTNGMPIFSVEQLYEMEMDQSEENWLMRQYDRFEPAAPGAPNRSRGQG